MERREAIKTATFILGYTLSAGAIAAVMSGCKSEGVPVTYSGSENANAGSWTPDFFTKNEMRALAELTETILPATNTPGAKDVYVHRFIDQAIRNHYPPRDQQEMRRGLEMIDMMGQNSFQQAFADLDQVQRTEIVSQLEEKLEAQIEAGQVLPASQPFYAMVKGMTLLGFFTSEKIGKEILNYDPIPGSYNGCIPISDVPQGRLWS